ncbi:MAG: hypothetical protein J7L04_14660, partial [Bacteroidales bacterium]|nr:hypothetical protein [Bacteroidales bacterium]
DSILLEYDKGTYPEVGKEIDFAKKNSAKRYKTLMKKRDLPDNPGNKEIVDYWEKRYKKPE